MLLGAIDVGTNSIHLIVVELDARFGTSRTVLRAREMVRLGGAGALARGELSKKAIARGALAIARFVDAARGAGAEEIRAVATSAVREAANRLRFVEAVRELCGLEVEVLSEREEARLIHLGVSHGYPLYDRVACIMDIGGGSTEFIVADATRPYFLRSVRLGSLRLFEEYLEGTEGRALPYGHLVRHVREVLEPLAAALRDYRFEVMLGTSGTITGLAALDAAAQNVTPARLHGYVLRRERLQELQKTMLRMTAAERQKMPGMNPRRGDIIVAGNAVAIAAMELLECDELIVCDRALREGIVVDFLARNTAVARRLGDERMQRLDAAHELAHRFGSDGVHENHVGALVLDLFDGLREVHGFEPRDRDALFAAALLHDVGRAVSASAHHKHGAYIVRNAGLKGWRPDEVALIAALVRYHRKALPKAIHAEWAQSDPVTRRRIEGLGALLRIADGLDVRRLGVVSHVGVRTANGQLELRIQAQQDVGPELAAARFKGDLFERAFGTRVRFEAEQREDGDGSAREDCPDPGAQGPAN